MSSSLIEAIVIGGSAGALDAVGAMLPALPADFGLPVVIVIHVAAGRASHLAELFGRRCALPVREPDDKEPLTAGVVHVAPPGYHLLIARRRTFALSIDPPVRFSRPSIDVLFESAADAYGPALAALLLSGANDDGARGLARIKAAGGTTAVQAPATAPVPTMPEAALRRTAIDHVLPLAELGPWLAGLDDRGRREEAR